MQKKLFIGVLGVLLINIMLSGCQDTSSVKTQQRPQNVYLDSTIVEFANVTYEENIDDSGKIESVTVGWLFHNIAEKIISIKIDVKFYDKNNLLLYNDTRYLSNMPPGYTEQTIDSANKVTFAGADSEFVDHIVISVTELV